MSKKPPLGARKDEKWYAMSTQPSINKTPIGPVQVSVPYQLISELSAATGTSANVKFNGRPVYLCAQSQMKTCVGDEQGSSGGIHSGTTSGIVKPKTGSQSLIVNHKQVVGLNDDCTMNGANCGGKIISAPSIAEVPPVANGTLRIDGLDDYAFCNTSYELSAEGRDEAGEYRWEHSPNCYLLDADGGRTLFGKKVKLVIRDDMQDHDRELEVRVSVTFQYEGGTARANASSCLHEGKGIDFLFDAFRNSAGTSLDDVLQYHTTHINSAGQRVSGPISDYNFENEPLALVVIPGMNMHAAGVQPSDLEKNPDLHKLRHTSVDEAEAMYTACNLSFGLRSSALVYNYSKAVSRNSLQNVETTALKERVPGFGDLTTTCELLEKWLNLDSADNDGNSLQTVQSLYYELFGAHDALVNATAYAIIEGLRQKGCVYVVAHDQGTEIFHTALGKLMCLPKYQEFEKKIFYQGFGPETYIHLQRSPYLGMARNVKGKEDKVPAVWTAFKYEKALLIDVMIYGSNAFVEGGKIGKALEKLEAPSFWEWFELLCSNKKLNGIFKKVFFKKIAKYFVEYVPDATKDELKGPLAEPEVPPKNIVYWAGRKIKSFFEDMAGQDLIDLHEQQWEIVDTPLPIHYQGIYKGKHNFFICPKNENDRVHGFLKMYWPYLKVPASPDPTPTKFVMPVENKNELAHVIAKKLLALEKTNYIPPGARVEKKGIVDGGNPADQHRKVTIVYFVDGLSFFTKQTNLQAMQKALLDSCKDLPATVSIWPALDIGPGKASSSPAEDELGDESMQLATKIYHDLSNEYDNYYSEGYRHIAIDLYGFSRGAAIVNEIAWMIDTDGIQLENMETVVPRGTAQVRFLGLFDTVHVMGDDGPNHVQRWHNKTIAGCVQHSAHALAANEMRNFYAPTRFHILEDQDTQFIQLKFPGIHTDIGGGEHNNPLISKLALSWMAQQASKAGVPYLERLVLNPEEEISLKRNPKLFQSGQEGYPNDADVKNGLLFFWEKNYWRDIAIMPPEERLFYLEAESLWKGIYGKIERKRRRIRSTRELEGIHNYVSPNLKGEGK